VLVNRSVAHWFISIGCFCAIGIINCPAAEKTKLAEGEYAVVKSPAEVAVGKTLDEWTLWRLPGGRLQVEARLPRWARGRYRQVGTSIQQSFTFAKEMDLIGYNVHLVTSDERMDLFCNLRPTTIRCRGPHIGIAEIQVDKAPYSFWPAEFYGMDWAWFYASLIHGDINPTFETPIYWLELPDPDTKMEIIPKDPKAVKYVGKERLTIMGKQVVANRYELEDEQSVVWTAATGGMVLAVEFRNIDIASLVTGDPIEKLELVKFKSYSPSFNPGFK